MASILIRARGLTKKYGSGKQEVVALDHVDVNIPAGQVTIILGPSGSGKSTLLNILGGMDHPTSGKIWCEDIQLDKLSDKQLTAYRRTHVGFVFQHYNLIPTLTASENVGIGSYKAKASQRTSLTKQIRRPVNPDEALEQVGLGGRGRSFPYELSGGEMQRVAIARALAKNPALLLCDEPTGALDSRTGNDVMRALAGTATSLGTTVVVVTHNSAFTEIADRVIHVQDGHIERVLGRAPVRGPARFPRMTGQ